MKGRVPTLRDEVGPQSRFANGNTVPSHHRPNRMLATGKPGSVNIPVGQPQSLSVGGGPSTTLGMTDWTHGPIVMPNAPVAPAATVSVPSTVGLTAEPPMTVARENSVMTFVSGFTA